MKKRKPASKAKKKSPTLKAKTLRSLGGAVLKSLPPNQWEQNGNWSQHKGLVRLTSVGGYPLPPDLEDAIIYYVDNKLPRLNHDIDQEPLHDDYDVWESSSISETGWCFIRQSLQDCFRQGFFLALLQYGDELKSNPEAAAMLAAMGKGREKAAELKRKKAEPERDAIRRQFRELRKSGFTKTRARDELVETGTKSFRQIERDTKGLS